MNFLLVVNLFSSIGSGVSTNCTNSYALVVMIYNWVTSKWTEYFEGLSSIEMSSTKEIKCVKLVHNEKVKIYAMMQPNGIDGANTYFL